MTWSKANSKLTASTSVAEIGGPGLGGLLIGALTAPVVIVLDAVSFVFSAVTIGLVRHRERRSPRPATAGIARQIGDGFRETVRNRSLLAFAGEAATYNVAWHALEVLLVLWAVTELGLTPATLGLLLCPSAASEPWSEPFSPRPSRGGSGSVAPCGSRP